jgi:hypothetical protein
MPDDRRILIVLRAPLRHLVGRCPGGGHQTFNPSDGTSTRDETVRTADPGAAQGRTPPPAQPAGTPETRVPPSVKHRRSHPMTLPFHWNVPLVHQRSNPNRRTTLVFRWNVPLEHQR